MAEFIAPPNCTDPVEPNNLSVKQAQQQIANLVKVIDESTQVNILNSLDAVLAEAIISPLDVPPHNNSAMDGYAINSKDIGDAPFSLKQVGIAYAGQPFNGRVQSGECVRIMTGAMMPADCDTVIIQEHVAINGDIITCHGEQKAGQHVRFAGEDIAKDSVVLNKGRLLTPADLGLLASLGIASVTVKRSVRVAFFSTGDELTQIGQPLVAGQIYDSNRYTLHGMLAKRNVEVCDLGVVPDDKAKLRQALQRASQIADVVITTGGVSVGDADYVKEILDELGRVSFWKIAMKPGRPLAFGQIDQALFFGLPGNPVSVMVTFYQFVLPALQQMAGQQSHSPTLMQVNCVSPIRKRTGRFEFQRGVLFQDEDGTTQVKTTGEQGSGILKSMSVANCFILLDEECKGIEANTQVTVQPFLDLM